MQLLRQEKLLPTLCSSYCNFLCKTSHFHSHKHGHHYFAFYFEAKSVPAPASGIGIGKVLIQGKAQLVKLIH